MNIAVIGGTGFVGRCLVQTLARGGHGVTVISTSAGAMAPIDRHVNMIGADTTRAGKWQDALAGVDVVINLAGRTIFKRWTDAYKKQLHDSRILTTRNIVQALSSHPQTQLLNASAVGYYGQKQCLDACVESSPAGNGFLAQLSVDWESEANALTENGNRVALMRFGVVLGTGGGAYAQMRPAFRLGLGGPLGSGKQWFPWIHEQDLVSAVCFLLSHDDLTGAFNFVAPHRVTQREFAKTLASALNRPAIVPAPSLVLRLALGEMASVLLTGQPVVPERLLSAGFAFKFGRLRSALESLAMS